MLDGPSSSRRCAPVLAAVALHAALPVVAWLAPPAALRFAAPSLDTVEVSIEASPPATERREPVASAETRATAPAPEAARRDMGAPATNAIATHDRAEPATASSGSLDPAGEPTSREAPAPARPEWDGPPADDRDVLAPGLGGAPIWAVPGAVTAPERRRPASTHPDAPAPVDPDVAGKVLRAEQAARDKSIGIDLPAAGTVAAAIADAARLTDTPHHGRATIVVRLGPDGSVLGVSVSRASSGHAAWERAARLAQSRLASTRLVMTGAFSRGATVVVQVSSRVQLPAGDSAGPSGVKPGAAPGTVGGGVAFDVSNLGAHASRVVTTTFQVTPAR